MRAPVFQSIYRDKLWRVELSEYGGQRRLSVWAHYGDRVSGEWKPCGGKRRHNVNPTGECPLSTHSGHYAGLVEGGTFSA